MEAEAQEGCPVYCLIADKEDAHKNDTLYSQG
jgi:hypothetical protein